MGVSIGDSLTATFGALGVLAALHHRSRTSEGQIVDAALYESVLQVMEGLVAEFSAGGAVRERSGAILPGIAPSNVYPCRDGEYLIGANNDQIFRRLCQAMGEPALADDPRYRDHVSRGRHQGQLDDHIAAWTATLTVAELEGKMLAASIPAGRLYAPADMLADPHFAAREAVVAVDHPRWPGLMMQSVFPKLSATPGAIRSIAPQGVGQHNAEILGGRLGLEEADLARLAAAGVI
jgi:formyl-CoA transferase